MNLVLECAALVLLAQAKDAQELFDQFEKQLAKASINTKPGQREKARSELRDAFEREIGRAAVKAPKKAWDYFSDHVQRLAFAEREFGGNDEGPEREIYLTACQSLLHRLVSQCVESKLPPDQQPTTSELFNECVEAVTRVRTRFTNDKSYDLAKAGYGAVNHVFQNLLRKSRAPKNDPKSLYTSHLDLVNTRFLLTREMDRAANEPAHRLLKDIAKACLDKAERK